jgi:hypothetical protein
MGIGRRGFFGISRLLDGLYFMYCTCGKGDPENLTDTKNQHEDVELQKIKDPGQRVRCGTEKIWVS